MPNRHLPTPLLDKIFCNAVIETEETVKINYQTFNNETEKDISYKQDIEFQRKACRLQTRKSYDLKGITVNSIHSGLQLHMQFKYYSDTSSVRLRLKATEAQPGYPTRTTFRLWDDDKHNPCAGDINTKINIDSHPTLSG